MSTSLTSYNMTSLILYVNVISHILSLAMHKHAKIIMMTDSVCNAAMLVMSIRMINNVQRVPDGYIIT